MKSRIRERDRVANNDRKFGSARNYYPAVLDTDGIAGDIPMLFTFADIDQAIARAAANPEDWPVSKSWWERLSGWFA